VASRAELVRTLVPNLILAHALVESSTTAACSDIDPYGLTLRYIMLDSVHSLRRRVSEE